MYSLDLSSIAPDSVNLPADTFGVSFVQIFLLHLDADSFPDAT